MHTIETPRSSSWRPSSDTLLLFAAGIAFAVALFAIVMMALAGEHDAVVVVPDGGRVVQQGERLDIYDSKSNRTAYGTVRPDGTVDVFNMDGSRRATIQSQPGGGVRVTTPGKR